MTKGSSRPLRGGIRPPVGRRSAADDRKRLGLSPAGHARSSGRSRDRTTTKGSRRATAHAAPFSPLLLDVNVLVALAWPNHQFHALARNRLESARDPWATCALTQLGFIRLSSNPAVVGVSKTPADAAALLARFLEDPHHIYLDALPAPAESPCLEGFVRILGSKQVTDWYLLSLAEQQSARFVTFDSRLAGLARAADAIEILGAS